METIIYQNNLLDLVILLAYLFGILALVRKFKVFPKKIYLLVVYIGLTHLLFTLVYYFYSFTAVADAKGYYLSVYHTYTSFSDTSIADGTSFIGFVLYPLIHIFGLSYLSCFFIFSFISLIGVYKLYEILLKINDFKWSNWFYLMLLPGMHFWTSSIGKDSLIFFGICVLLNAYFFKRAYTKYILPLLLIGLVRFYILAFIGAGFFLALILLSKQIKLGYKILLMGVFAGAVILIAPYFFESISLSGLEQVEKQKEIIQQANMEGGGAVNLSNANILVKWFSYLFRPFVFEAKSFFALVTAIENLVWMVIFYKIFLGIKRKNIRVSLNSFFWICFVSIFTITLPAAFLLSNLGIAARQKNMIVPFMFIVFFILLINHRPVASQVKARK